MTKEALRGPTVDQSVLERVRFGRLEFTTGSREGAIARLTEWFDLPDRAATMVGFINPHVYNCAGEHPAAGRFLRECCYVCVDGIGVAIGARLLYGTALPRVVATDLFEGLFAAVARPIEALLIGTTAQEVAAAADKINAGPAGLRILETMDGFRELDAYESLFARHADIDAVLVGAGTPKSEQILLLARDVCGRALGLHIGAGTIKLYADTKRKAPRLVSRLGLEWLHRMIFEPHTRSRYLGGAWSFATDLVRTRRHDAEGVES